jgi:hypothetical protein
MMRRLPCALCAFLLCVLWPARAWADATAFWGLNYTPTTRTAKGFAVGVTLIVLGFEYEYSKTTEDEPEAAPQLTSHMGNVLLQTPTGRAQLYFTAGAGFYQEVYRTLETNGFGTNLGGGLKFTLAGPLRVRVDYRIFNLRGEPLYTHPKRLYVGATIAF